MPATPTTMPVVEVEAAQRTTPMTTTTTTPVVEG
jgi:hypothetical protein